MIIEYKIKCDECGKIIDAKKETFRETAEGEQICNKCYDELGG
jgi:DNA-directed RNA polymerase subunit N (RpoN/RPB10)